MTKPNIPQKPTNGPTPNPQPPIPFPRLSARQACHVGALACEHLLTGQPAACTFDPADLELAAALLRHLAALVAKEGRA